MTFQFANSDEFSKRSGWLIATRLSVGFLSIVCLVALLSPWKTASANPVILAQTAKPGIPAQADAIAQKMLGQWLTKEPLAGDMVMFVFAPNGKAFLISGKAPDGKPLARAIQYSINSKARPMHLNVILSQDSTVQTVFEFTPAGDLRIQMLETYPGKPRPTALNTDATVFQQISDSTTLPPNTVLMNPSSL